MPAVPPVSAPPRAARRGWSRGRRAPLRVLATLVAASVPLAGCATADAPTAGPITASASAGAEPDSAAGSFGSAADLSVLDGISVVGEATAKATPAVTFATKPVSVSATARKVLTPGAGPGAKVGGRVKAVVALFKGSDGSVIDSTYPQGLAQSIELDPDQMLRGLVRGLTGVQPGSRVLVVIPPADAYGPTGRADLGISSTENLVLVADVTRVDATIPSALPEASGAPVTPAPGLPTVTFESGRGPTITVPATPPPTSLVSQPLVTGTGEPVAAGQVLTVHYTGVLWKDGSVFDSSWTRGQPFGFPVGAGRVIAGWDRGLVGVPVGSRVLLVVPPEAGYGSAGSPPKISGTDTLVFVVDVLAAD